MAMFDRVGLTDLFVRIKQEEIPQVCFHCGENLWHKKVSGVTMVVHWDGATGSITVHDTCAQKLGGQIYRDGMRASLLSAYHSITERDPEAVRVAREMMHKMIVSEDT